MKILKFFLFSFCGMFLEGLLADAFPFTPPTNFSYSVDYVGIIHPTSTKNKNAQNYFDQGLTFLYAFNHDAAYWSFLKASEEDPSMGMAYWGMALALGTNINMEMPTERYEKSYALIQKALNLSKDLPEDEQDYIKALTKRYSPDPAANRAQLAIDYSEAMKKVATRYPDDPDASVLYVESLLDLNPWDQWTLDGKAKKGTFEALNTLENVLKKYPLHLGANHYYIHTIEASKYPERGLISAQRLRTLLPSSGHILHMPSHIYLLVGEYHQAALINEEAIKQDKAYISKYGIQGIYPIHYLSHNIYFLSRAYAMEGDLKKSLDAAKELNDFYVPHFKTMPELEYYASAYLFALIRFQQWNDIVQITAPSEEMQITNALWHFGKALALTKLGDTEQAKKEQKAFMESKDQLPSDIRFGYNVGAVILKIAEYVLGAALAEAGGNANQAIEKLRLAVQEQDRQHYNEPPDWSFPIRENLGGLLVRTKQYIEAEKTFRDDLEIHPRNGRSLYGLKECLKAQQKDYDYYWVNKAFEEAWRYSDIQLNLKDL